MEQREQVSQAAEDNISYKTSSSDSDSKYDNLLLDGLYHINRGMPLLFDEKVDEKVALEYASLNKLAAEQARQAIAYESSLSFLRSGVEFFKYAKHSNQIWSSEHNDFEFSLYSMLCETLVLNHLYEEAKETAMYLEGQCVTDLQRATIYSLLLSILSASNKFAEMIDVGMKGLQVLGVQVPATQIEISKMLDHTITEIDKLLERKTTTELAINQVTNEVNTMKEHHHRLALRIIMELCIATQANFGDLYPLLISLATLTSLRYGITDDSPVAFSLYSSFIITHEAQFAEHQFSIQRAYDFSTLAIRLADISENAVMKCKAYYSFGAYNATFFRSLSESMQLVGKSYKFGLESGEVYYSSLARAYHATGIFFTDIPLSHASAYVNEHSGYLEKIKDKDTGAVLSAFGVLLKTLQIAFYDMDDTTAVNVMKDKNNLYALTEYNVLKSYMLYVLTDGDNKKEKLHEAQKCILEAYAHINLIKGRFIESVLNMLMVLVPAAVYDTEDADTHQIETQVYLNRLASWVEVCPQNFAPMYLIAAAELKRIEAIKFEESSNILKSIVTVNTARLQAADLYNRAIAAAEEAGYTFLVALCNELCAKFILQSKHYPNQKNLSHFYIEKSFMAYKRWEAFGKCATLGQKYHLDIEANVTSSTSSTSSFEASTGGTTNSKRSSAATISSHVFDSQSFMSSFMNTRPTANTFNESNLLKVTFFLL
jgi:hypothetical protein